MGYRVYYIGNDSKFWEQTQKGIKRVTDSELEFSQVRIDSSFEPGNVFINLYNSSPDIIYLDLCYETDKSLSLSKLLCRNNETRLKSLVLLHDQNMGHKSLLRGVLSGARLNYFKNVDTDELVSHPFSLLDSEFENEHAYAGGAKIRNFQFKQIIRIGYISDDHYRGETNCELEMGEIIELDSHPLEGIMPSNRVLPEKFSDSDLYYNQRYSYNLKYTYLKDDFFLASEKAWIKFKQAGSREQLIKKYGNDASYILEDLRKRSKKLMPIRQDVKDWTVRQKANVEPKRLKVLVIDETLEVFQEYLQHVENFKHTINFQTRLTKDFYQIRRSRPHLILFHFQKFGNNKKVLVQVVQEIKKFNNYNPAIIVFNYHDNSEVLKNVLGYESIICSHERVALDLAMKMAKLLNEKFHITDSEEKVFLESSDPASFATCIREGEIIKFNESEMMFSSKLTIPMWTTFILEKPLKALITVIPMRTKETSAKKVYRALINGIGEIEKNELRRLVNQSLG